MNDTTDWYDVTEIGAESYQITEGVGQLQCNSFVVADGGQAVVIDTGLGIGNLRAVVKRLAGSDVRVLLTHSHWDHIGAAHQFDDLYIDSKERSDAGRVAIDVLSEEFLERPRQFVAGWRSSGRSFPRGFDPDAYSIEPVDDVGVVSPGERIPVGDRLLEIVAIPGHSPGQMAVLDRESEICYGADILEPNGGVYIHFEDSDIDVYRASIDRLVALRDAGSFDMLATGHQDPIRGSELETLDEVAEALKLVSEERSRSEIVRTNWGPTRKHDVGNITVFTRP